LTWGLLEYVAQHHWPSNHLKTSDTVYLFTFPLGSVRLITRTSTTSSAEGFLLFIENTAAGR